MFTNMDYVYEVYKEGSFSKAAANLYISQPSLSASVKRVEEKIGYPIFDRGTKPLSLTEVGKKYIESLMAIRQIEKNFDDYVNDYGELKNGTVRLGGTNLVSSLIAPKIINKFREKYPQIVTELQEGVTSDLREMLASGSIDMVIDYGLPYYDSFDSLKIADEYLVLAVPKSFSVNRGLEKYRLDIEDIKSGTAMSNEVPEVPLIKFKDVPFVLLKKINDTYNRSISLCNAAGFEPIHIFEAAQQMTSYHVCCSGHGAAFVSSLLLSGVSPNPDIFYYKLDSRYATRQLCILWKKERYLTKAMQEFGKMAAAEFL